MASSRPYADVLQRPRLQPLALATAVALPVAAHSPRVCAWFQGVKTSALN